MLDLLQGCRQNDPQAQRQLFELYGERLYRVAYRYTQDQMEAEDAVAEAFVKVFQHLPKTPFAAIAPFEAWLRKITINKALELVRKKKAWRNRPNNYAPSATVNEDGIFDSLSLQEVLSCIQLLPEGYRTVLQLHALEGYTHGEIAEALGINIGTSKSQLNKARGMLQQLLKKSDVL